ncbi:pentapeptide repeat-containing protein [Actinoallomurus iriomotensis]|uniref:Pentapeptide repeat-containing protein n=1 Tax=Actinoallomurus iriomotensis TaxID=478107 RepID=A0A9W6RH83_9ACTN|nr:pentapeptide repeat-containing protein [Actinoallomurus iriomotensis]GLY74640.1 hypothetical protein Airi01_029070 [Actinoallomurus iriomotensis]
MVTILGLLLGPVTSWAGGAVVRHLHDKEKADAINGVRQTLLQAAAGTVALTVLVFTGLTWSLNRRGQVTDRYVKAIGLLSSEKLDERIGGIYALEHIMIESERDHETVVQVLAAFVREHAAAAPTRPDLWIDPPPKAHAGQVTREPEPATDVRTALTVLGRRPKRKENQPLDLRRSDLRGADLRRAHLEGADLGEACLDGANLREAHLAGANLTRARLARANLTRAHLEGATLWRTHLKGADLCESHLEGADLWQAQFEDADLREAHLEGADLWRAHLKGADLWQAHLEGAKLSDVENLVQLQLEGVFLDAHTELPAQLTPRQANGSSKKSPS